MSQDTQANQTPADTTQDTAPQDTQNQTPAPNKPLTPSSATAQSVQALKSAELNLQNAQNNPPQINLTPATNPLDEQRLQELKAFDTKLNDALNNMDSFKEHTRLNLEALSELYKISQDTFSFYQTQLNELINTNQAGLETKAHIEVIANYINQALQTLSTASQTALSIYNKCEAELDLAQEIYSFIETKSEEAKKTLKTIETISVSVMDMKALQVEFQRLVTQGEALKQQIQALVPNIVLECKNELREATNNHEDELNTTKTNALNELTTKQSELNQIISDFNTDFATKELTINEANAKIEQFLSDLNTKAQEVLATHTANLEALENAKNTHLATLQTKKNEHTQALESAKNTHIATLQTKTDEHTATLETKKNEHTQALESATNTHIATLQTKTDEHTATLETKKNEHIQALITQKEQSSNDMQGIKDSYLAEIRNDIPAQVANLTQLCNEIKASNQALGSNFQSKTYTSSTTFSLVNGVSDYYVFIQGGTGGTNSNTAGGAVSFGNLLSANGGAGNPSGAGQLGQTKGAFLKVTANQKMTIPNGGLIIVSYATR